MKEKNMLKTIKTAVLLAGIGCGALAAAPATALAGESYLGIGGGSSRPGVEFFVGSHRGYTPRRHQHWHRYSRPSYQACSSRRALYKAASMGLRRARVHGVDRYAIRIAGYARHGYSKVAFGHSWSCPVLRWY
jgi:hypothetical protein